MAGPLGEAAHRPRAQPQTRNESKSTKVPWSQIPRRAKLATRSRSKAGGRRTSEPASQLEVKPVDRPTPGPTSQLEVKPVGWSTPRRTFRPKTELVGRSTPGPTSWLGVGPV